MKAALSYIKIMMSKKCLLFCVCAVIIIPINKAQDPCNETQLVTAWDGTITSPGYPTYANNLSCNWLISVTPGNRIEITFHVVQLTSDADPASPCDKDFIEVREGRNSSSPLITRLCAPHALPEPVQSRGTDIWLSFVTDAADSYVGFILGHRGVCNVEFNSTSGVITSPNYPNNYFIYLNCLWVIELLPQAQITLTFHTFELEGVDDNDECAFDFLEIRAGTTAESPLLGKYCGNGSISTFVRHGNFTIKFKTDSDDEYMGFRLSFTTKVFGVWTEWTNWSECSKTYYHGNQTRSRRCKNPVPEAGYKLVCNETSQVQRQECVVSNCTKQTSKASVFSSTVQPVSTFVSSIEQSSQFTRISPGSWTTYTSANISHEIVTTPTGVTASTDKTSFMVATKVSPQFTDSRLIRNVTPSSSVLPTTNTKSWSLQSSSKTNIANNSHEMDSMQTRYQGSSNNMTSTAIFNSPNLTEAHLFTSYTSFKSKLSTHSLAANFTTTWYQQRSLESLTPILTESNNITEFTYLTPSAITSHTSFNSILSTRPLALNSTWSQQRSLDYSTPTLTESYNMTKFMYLTPLASNASYSHGTRVSSQSTPSRLFSMVNATLSDPDRTSSLGKTASTLTSYFSSTLISVNTEIRSTISTASTTVLHSNSKRLMSENTNDEKWRIVTSLETKHSLTTPDIRKTTSQATGSLTKMSFSSQKTSFTNNGAEVTTIRSGISSSKTSLSGIITGLASTSASSVGSVKFHGTTFATTASSLADLSTNQASVTTDRSTVLTEASYFINTSSFPGDSSSRAPSSGQFKTSAGFTRSVDISGTVTRNKHGIPTSSLYESTITTSNDHSSLSVSKKKDRKFMSTTSAGLMTISSFNESEFNSEYSMETFSKIGTVLRKSSPYIKLIPSLTSYTDVSITPTAVVPAKPSDKPPNSTEKDHIVWHLIPFVVVLLLLLSFIILRLLHAPDLFSAFLSYLKKKREKGKDKRSEPSPMEQNTDSLEVGYNAAFQQVFQRQIIYNKAPINYDFFRQAPVNSPAIETRENDGNLSVEFDAPIETQKNDENLSVDSGESEVTSNVLQELFSEETTSVSGF